MDVGGEPGNQCAGRMAVKKRQVHAREMIEETVLHVGENAQADKMHQHRLGVVGNTFNQKGRQNREGDDP